MATDAPRDEGGGALSLRTLLVASGASALAAVVVHQLWQPGAIIGAAITPILVALFSEALRRPAQRVTVPRGAAAPGGRRAAAGEPVVATGKVTAGGLSERRVYGSRRGPRRLRLALLVGVAAFALGGAALTLSELVLDGAVAHRDQTTLFGGSDRDEATTTEDQPEEPAPAEPRDTDPAPAQPAPAEEDEAQPAPSTTPAPPPSSRGASVAMRAP
jgi:hypothetical protein